MRNKRKNKDRCVYEHKSRIRKKGQESDVCTANEVKMLGIDQSNTYTVPHVGVLNL